MFSKDLDKPIVLQEGNCLAFDLSDPMIVRVLVLPKKDSPKKEAFSWLLSKYVPAKLLNENSPAKIFFEHAFSIEQLSSLLAAVAGLEIDYNFSRKTREDGLLIVPLCEPAAVTARKILKKK
jgi:hypothetical protein